MTKMKTFIIYNEPNPKSKDIANSCLESFSNFNSWEPILFDGCNPNTLKIYQEKYKIKDDRTQWKSDHIRYKSKKSCFYSHFELWLKAIELNETIAIVEHDTYCVLDLPEDLEFNGVLQLTVESASCLILRRIREESYETIMEKGDGIHDMCTKPNESGHISLISGTGYAITPEAAKIITEDCFKNGWQQNDMLLTTEYFSISYLLPSPIVYDKEKELGTSINYNNGK